MRFSIFCGLVAAFLCLAQSANAQYARKGADLVNQNGVVLSDQDIIDLVGGNIFDETVIGARKQYKAGKSLITGGLVGSMGNAGSFVNVCEYAGLQGSAEGGQKSREETSGLEG